MPSEQALRDAIHVFPGTDPLVLNNVQDPAGFSTAGFSPAAIEGICSFVKDVYINVLLRAPEKIADDALRNIPLHRLPPDSIEGGACLMKPPIYDWEQVPGGMTPKGNRPAELRGMRIQVAPDTALTNQKLQHDTGHECTHIAINRCTGAFHSSMQEAFVMRLGKEYRREPPLINMNWNPAAFGATTGFCPPDFAKIDFRTSRAMLIAMYTSAYHALDSLSAEQVWKIAGVLHERTRETGHLPRAQQVCDVIRAETQERSAHVLAQPAFRIMLPGIHHFTFPTKDGTNAGDTAYLCTFEAARRPDYGQIDPNNILQEFLLTCRDNASKRFSVTCFDKGNATSKATVGFPLLPVTKIEFGVLKNAIGALKGGRDIEKRMTDKVLITVAGLPAIDIQKKKHH